MSLILEALRKSEAERRRGHTPDVAMELPPVPLRTRHATPAWVWPTLLGVIVVAALAWWWTGRDDADQAAASTMPAAVTVPIEPAPQAPAVVPRTAIATPPIEVASAPATEPSPRDSAATAVATRAPPPSIPAQAPARDVPPPPAPIAMPPAPVALATSMSGVKLSMHMWDAAADKRFVILNGQRMGEGDRNGDVQVVAIERDGVLVERDGQRARVPLP